MGCGAIAEATSKVEGLRGIGRSCPDFPAAEASGFGAEPVGSAYGSPTRSFRPHFGHFRQCPMSDSVAVIFAPQTHSTRTATFVFPNRNRDDALIAD